MSRAIVRAKAERWAAFEPLYEIDPRTGVAIEIFYADRILAVSFGAQGPGWFHWSCQRGCLPEDLPIGPFGSSYRAYRDALGAGELFRK
jgi:hypothetical protein